MTKAKVITKPMLSGKADLSKLTYPLLCTPKLDGIRALKVNGKLVTRTFKDVPNVFIRETLERILPDGIDGEVMVGSTFQECSSGVMRRTGEPDFTYHAFDYVSSSLSLPYRVRMSELRKWHAELPPEDKKIVLPVLPVVVKSKVELDEFEMRCLADGYEGVMTRIATGPYKCGRSTPNEGFLLKVKRFEDSEAEIIGYEERMHNDNVAEKDNFGRTKRSSHQENMRGAGDLGKFIVRDLVSGLEFGVGSGFNALQRKQLWADKENQIGKIIRYHYFPIGVKELPRHPIFDGFRSKLDM